MAIVANVGFNDSGRNLAQGAHVVVLHSGSVAGANEKVANVLNAYELLETQGKQIVGQKLWTTVIEPLL